MNPEIINLDIVVCQFAQGGSGGLLSSLCLSCSRIADGFPCPLDIYVGAWDSDSSLYVCPVNTVLAELPPQLLKGGFDPACICVGHGMAASILNT